MGDEALSETPDLMTIRREMPAGKHCLQFPHGSVEFFHQFWKTVSVHFSGLLSASNWTSETIRCWTDVQGRSLQFDMWLLSRDRAGPFADDN